MSDPFARGVDGASVFDNLDALKVNLDVTEETEELLTRVPVRRPDKRWFVRVNPQHNLPVLLVEDTESRETYLVLPGVRGELSDYAKPVTLLLAVNRQGVTFLWPAPAPDPRSQWPPK